MPVDDVLASLSRRLSVQVFRSGRVVCLGDLRPEDKGILVRRVARLKSDELRAAVTACLSDIGNVSCLEDGLVIVSDRVEIIGRVSELLDGIESAPSGGFVVQLFVFSLSHEAQKNLGVNAVPIAEAAANVGTAGTTWDGKLGMSLVLKATATDKNVQVVGRPLMFLSDGAAAQVKRVRTDPVPKKTTSDQGVVTTLEYTPYETGFTVDVSARRVDAERARLTVSLELSDIIGKVDDTPITRKESGKSELILRLCSPVLVMSLERNTSERSNEGIFQLNPSSLDRREILQVFAIVVPVS